MRYYLDTEFIESVDERQPLYLISLALVAEDNRSLYIINESCNHNLADDWVRDNVLPHITETDRATFGLQWPHIKPAIRAFIGEDRPQFWGWYCAYDWFLFCKIFGRLLDLPLHYPRHCMDVKQFLVSIGDPNVPRMPTFGPKHHPHSDARWIKAVHELALSGALNQGMER